MRLAVAAARRAPRRARAARGPAAAHPRTRATRPAAPAAGGAGSPWGGRAGVGFGRRPEAEVHGPKLPFYKHHASPCASLEPASPCRHPPLPAPAPGGSPTPAASRSPGSAPRAPPPRAPARPAASSTSAPPAGGATPQTRGAPSRERRPPPPLVQCMVSSRQHGALALECECPGKTPYSRPHCDLLPPSRPPPYLALHRQRAVHHVKFIAPSKQRARERPPLQPRRRRVEAPPLRRGRGAARLPGLEGALEQAPLLRAPSEEARVWAGCALDCPRRTATEGTTSPAGVPLEQPTNCRPPPHLHAHALLEDALVVLNGVLHLGGHAGEDLGECWTGRECKVSGPAPAKTCAKGSGAAAGWQGRGPGPGLLEAGSPSACPPAHRQLLVRQPRRQVVRQPARGRRGAVAPQRLGAPKGGRAVGKGLGEGAGGQRGTLKR
jgi:hypothetical protein